MDQLLIRRAQIIAAANQQNSKVQQHQDQVEQKKQEIEQAQQNFKKLGKDLIQHYVTYYIILFPLWSNCIPDDKRNDERPTSPEWIEVLKKLVFFRNQVDRKRAINKHCKFIFKHSEKVYKTLCSHWDTVTDVGDCMNAWGEQCKTYPTTVFDTWLREQAAAAMIDGQYLVLNYPTIPHLPNRSIYPFP
jgi:hypothetical protein